MFDRRSVHILILIHIMCGYLLSGCIIDDDSLIPSQAHNPLISSESEAPSSDQTNEENQELIAENQVDGYPSESDSSSSPSPVYPETQEGSSSDLPKISIVDRDMITHVSYFSSGDSSGIPSYMIGIYETHSDHFGGVHPMGDADVVIEEQRGAISLVLHSYEPVTWHLSGPGVEQISRLVLLGYHDQFVDGDDLMVNAETFTSAQYNTPPAFVHSMPEEGLECQNLNLSELLDSNDLEGDDQLDRDLELMALYDEDRTICEFEKMTEFLDELDIDPIDAFAGTYRASSFLIHSTVDLDPSSVQTSVDTAPIETSPTARLEMGVFTAEYFNTRISMNEPVYVEQVDRPSIQSAWARFHNIDSEDFYVVWTGSITATDAADIEVIADFSWSDVRVYIDEIEVLRGSEQAEIQVTQGTHHVRVEYRNHWHTIGFNLRIDTIHSTPTMTPQNIENSLVSVVSLYESDEVYNQVHLTISEGTEPLFLVLASHSGVNWVIENRTGREIKGILLSGYSLASTIEGISTAVPTYRLNDDLFEEPDRLEALCETYLGTTQFNLIEHYNVIHVLVD